MWDGQEAYADIGPDGSITLVDDPPAPLELTLERTVGEPAPSANLLVTAPAHLGLAALRADPAYGAQIGDVKVAYLDPPYNTGRTFAQYRDRAHRGAWLTMLRDTLVQVRETLRADGCVWLHLDDREVHRARLVADEVFGEDQFVADVVWERKRKPSFLHAQIAQVTDHLLVYARDRSQLARFGDDAPARATKVPLHHAGGTVRELVLEPGTVTFGFADRTVPAGDMSTATIDTQLLEDLVVSGGTNVNALRMKGPFRFTQERLDAELANGVTVHVPRIPLRPHLLIAPRSRTWTTLFTRATAMATNESAKEHSSALFGAPFDTPKPEELLRRIITGCSEPGDLVLDVFSGSGTTAATAHKLGRRWVALEVSADVVARYTSARLTQVVEGKDPGGITFRTELSPRFRLPDAMTARDARRAGEWVSSISQAGGFEGLDEAGGEELVRRVREESTRTLVHQDWTGGGGFVVLSSAARQPTP